MVYDSRIPLHLRGKTRGAADAVIDSTKSNHANIANREKISTDQTVRKTRVGRIFQTPARFVQVVHAIVAPNDIYGGPNRMHRIHNVLIVNEYARPGSIMYRYIKCIDIFF